nr:YkvA family protein [Kineococcus aurantiacus]
MARDAVTGRWTGPGRRRLAAAAAGTLYLIAPVDAVPELWLPFVGWLDDGLVATAVAASVRAATEQYVQDRVRRPAGDHPRVHRGPRG